MKNPLISPPKSAFSQKYVKRERQSELPPPLFCAHPVDESEEVLHAEIAIVLPSWLVK